MNLIEPLIFIGLVVLFYYLGLIIATWEIHKEYGLLTSYRKKRIFIIPFWVSRYYLLMALEKMHKSKKEAWEVAALGTICYPVGLRLIVEGINEADRRLEERKAHLRKCIEVANKINENSKIN